MLRCVAHNTMRCMGGGGGGGGGSSNAVRPRQHPGRNRPQHLVTSVAAREDRRTDAGKSFFRGREILATSPTASSDRIQGAGRRSYGFFQDTKTDQGFEVYVTPYADKQITPQRFKLDEPSGVIQSPTDVVIDGERATMFFGNNTIMGDTREVCSSTA